MGNMNLEYEYKLGENVINSSKTKQDLVVVICKSGKSTEQCILAAKKGNVIILISFLLKSNARYQMIEFTVSNNLWYLSLV